MAISLCIKWKINFGSHFFQKIANFKNNRNNDRLVLYKSNLKNHYLRKTCLLKTYNVSIRLFGTLYKQ